MKPIGKLQEDHFRSMTPAERRVAIEDSAQQIRHLDAAKTRAALVKRAELQARIEFLAKLGRE